MTGNAEIETFVDLTFYPPVDKDEYVSKVPESVKQKIAAFAFSGTSVDSLDNLFKRQINAFCCDYTHSLHRNYLEIFWGALREELIEYYRQNWNFCYIGVLYHPTVKNISMFEMAHYSILHEEYYSKKGVDTLQHCSDKVMW